jgi:transposase-like protein
MMTLTQLMERFPDETACLDYLVAMRWPDGQVTCPRCGNAKLAKLKRPYRWQCKKCQKNGYRFSPLVGTIFENTNYPLRIWFQVIYLMCTSKKGISALQIHRMIGSGSYRTAWYMCHRIRAAMRNETFVKLTGVVEVDETFVGGKAKNRHGGGAGGGLKAHEAGRGPVGKVPVVGAISRKGNVVCQMIENTDRATLEGFVDKTVAESVSLVATDEHPAYWRLARHGWPHASVSHASREYVRGDVHTACIDNFWSLLKRGIVGTFHKVSADYLPLYLNEFTFRHNNRENPDMFGAVVRAS